MADEVKVKKRTHGTTPRKEADIITVAENVAKAWEKHPQLTLIWINPAGLKEATGTFRTSFTVRNETKGSRAVITRTIKAVNAEIDLSVRHVKSYIAEMYGIKNATAYYAQFGLIKVRDVYKFPVDNDRRLFALEQLIEALGIHGMNGRKYGRQYWMDILEQFVQVKSQAAESDSASAEHVSIKSSQKVTISKTLNALINIIKANYPDSWKEELRVWGFQKEKY